MDLTKAIEARRAYRSLEPVEIKEDLIRDLARHASLAPSCYNKQPWRFVFAAEAGKLKELTGALNKGNEWAHKASMIIAAFSKPDLDCQIKEREYYQFDTGMAAALLMLRATELGLIAHPIAGYDPEAAAKILGIPEEFELITLIIVGKRATNVSPDLSDWQKAAEESRPPRAEFEKFAWLNKFGG